MVNGRRLRSSRAGRRDAAGIEFMALPRDGFADDRGSDVPTMPSDVEREIPSAGGGAMTALFREVVGQARLTR